jgi:hypothetical protein
MAGARHGMCELTAWHDRGTAWARHDMCESALKWTIWTVSRAPGTREDKPARFVCCYGCLRRITDLCYMAGEPRRFFSCHGCLHCLVLLFQGKINLILILLLPWLLAMHVMTAVSKKKPSNNYSFSMSRFVTVHVFDFDSSCFLQELTTWK